MRASLRIWCVAREEKAIAFTIDWPSMQDMYCNYYTLAAMVVYQVIRALTKRFVAKFFCCLAPLPQVFLHSEQEFGKWPMALMNMCPCVGSSELANTYLIFFFAGLVMHIAQNSLTCHEDQTVPNNHQTARLISFRCELCCA